mgnify:FL=1
MRRVISRWLKAINRIHVVIVIRTESCLRKDSNMSTCSIKVLFKVFEMMMQWSCIETYPSGGRYLSNIFDKALVNLFVIFKGLTPLLWKLRLTAAGRTCSFYTVPW